MEDKRLLVSLYDGCQYHCTFCMYGYVKEEHPLSDKDSMSLQRWNDVLLSAYAHGFRVLEIGGRGEPTLNPAFTKVVAMAHELGYKIELLSNALNDKAILEVLPFIRTLTINLNAVDQEGLARIHQPSPGFSFDRCIGSVKNVLRGILENGLGITLRTNYVVTAQSLKDAFTFPQEVNRLLAAELGGRKLYVSYQHVHNYIKTPKHLGFDYEGLHKVLLLAKLNSRRKDLWDCTNLQDFIKKTEKLLERLRPFSEGRGTDAGCCYTCGVHKYVLFIDGNGDCYGCYNPFRAVNGLPIDQDPFFFGNLLSQSFDEIISGKEDFSPVMDISKNYWRPCLLCKATEAPLTAHGKDRNSQGLS
ncbi:MAG: radical SAM protein [Candidatus Omnitrophica bacterium]|nr:radical SAM protein [Candidatus Omnitrophota bacterium]MDE2008572.1 radical SAM protein [Candidatus Omnitrophota bacterium]MDE2214038.1 radical SAM protein [Candidatus Omnitrophota bacterium]